MELAIYNTESVSIEGKSHNDTHWIELVVAEHGDQQIEITLYFNSLSEMEEAIEVFKECS